MNVIKFGDRSFCEVCHEVNPTFLALETLFFSSKPGHRNENVVSTTDNHKILITHKGVSFPFTNNFGQSYFPGMEATFSLQIQNAEKKSASRIRM
jgi:hypothetical protein